MPHLSSLVPLSVAAVVAFSPAAALEPIGAIGSTIHDDTFAAANLIAQTKAQPAAIDLAAMADTDPALAIREGEDGDADSMMMLSDVLFAFGKAQLEPEAIVILEGIAPQLEGAGAIEIAGHTDAIGDEADNEALGLRRANAVRSWLIENSALQSDDVVAIGIGEVDPIADNVLSDGSDNPEGRALNRRVEFVLPETEDTELASVE